MRKVNRGSATLPEILHGDEVRAAKAALAEHYRLDPQERARRRPPLNAKIWTSAMVRRQVAEVFLSKCAYCETPLDSSNSGDVSHHRPPGNAVGFRDQSDVASPDHYSWFAYEWENIFLSCAACNRAKRNLFPVQGPRARLRSSWAEAENGEEALLVNPCRVEPRKHMRFGVDGSVVGADEVGRVTVEVLNLNRPDLTQVRAQTFRQCFELLDQGRTDEEYLNGFRRALLDEAPFCGAMRVIFFELLSDFNSSASLPKPSFRTIVDDAIHTSKVASDKQWRELVDHAESGAPLLDRNSWRPLEEQLMTRFQWEPRTSQLRRVRIQNFKGIANLDLEIPHADPHETGAPCMMLLGENSTGKSTTLQAIALAMMGSPMRARMGVLPEDFLPREVSGWQLDDTVMPEVILDFDTGEPVRLQIDPLTKRFIGEEQPTMMLMSFGSRRFFGKEGVRRQPASTLRSLFDPFAKLQHPGRWLQGLAPDAFDALARALREVLVLQPEDRIGRDEEGRLFVHAHGRDTPLERLSDGYRSLIAMVLDIMRDMLKAWGDLENARGLVLIDEIETHLHPRWKLRVVSALRKAMPNVQFVATTHDPLCLRGMRDDEVQVFVRDEAHRIEVLSGLPDVRGLRAEQLLTSDYFGLASTADPDVESALEHLALPAGIRSQARDEDIRALQAFKWLGDTPVEQIVNEALRRFVDEGAGLPQDRGQLREAAVTGVLARLRALRAGPQA
ncbi:AAA family ATPase [Variovorax paradoxus]|uniref:AAA family ATPase n=1 Tax=Variovorax paradoxus TaxID=34073 RepID=UPI002480D823|nr:AAA family ATPase [Variovorax paradoxus]WGT61754.1 AAA family ATPase [Variovorax paradoxus]WGT61791.1 AAA family ATPase [Variovorax paradoxus]